jgi:hypothetical protein
MSAFGDEFKKQRAAGAKEFSFNGKRYHTRTAEEDAKTMAPVKVTAQPKLAPVAAPNVARKVALAPKPAVTGSGNKTYRVTPSGANEVDTSARPPTVASRNAMAAENNRRNGSLPAGTNRRVAAAAAGQEQPRPPVPAPVARVATAAPKLNVRDYRLTQQANAKVSLRTPTGRVGR